MKQRQCCHHHVFVPGIEHIGNLANVAHDVAVAQHHPFGLAFAAAGEENGRRLFQFYRSAEQCKKQPRGKQYRCSQKGNLGETADFILQLFESVNLYARQKFAQIHTLLCQLPDEAAGGVDAADLCLVHRGLQRRQAGGVVQIYQCLAAQQRRHIGNETGAAGR